MRRNFSALDKCPQYPSAREVRKVATMVFRGFMGSSRDARGLGLADVEQELHLKACEVLARDRDAPADYVWASIWNRARSLRRKARTPTVAKNVSRCELDWAIGGSSSLHAEINWARLESRDCLARLDAALSPTGRDTLRRVAYKTSAENQQELGLTHEGWRKRRLSVLHVALRCWSNGHVHGTRRGNRRTKRSAHYE